MKKITMCLVILFFSGIAFAKGKPGGGGNSGDISITQEIADEDGNFVPYFIQSDGGGVYRDESAGGVIGDMSVLMSNVCNGLTYGDRLLDLSSAQVRQVTITVDSTNALQSGDFGYLVPAQPLGTVGNSIRMMNKCTCLDNISMYTMTPDSRIYCEMHLRLSPLDDTSNYYRLDMGVADEPETEKVQITCNSSGADGNCNDWVIEPNSDPDLTVNPGKTRARLNYFVTKGRGSVTNKGAFYMTFRIHVSRP